MRRLESLVAPPAGSGSGLESGVALTVANFVQANRWPGESGPDRAISWSLADADEWVVIRLTSSLSVARLCTFAHPRLAGRRGIRARSAASPVEPSLSVTR